ncbi:MAG: CBS domain-containing protein [Pseudomonadales bacterium]
MVFYIHEQGARISTPIQSFFKTGGVAAVSPYRAIQKIGSDIEREESRAVAERRLPGDKKSTAGQRGKAIFARQIMSRPVQLLAENQLVAEASRILGSAPFHHIPIVDQQKKLCGILSDRDILRADPAKTIIRDIMTHRVITASANTEIKLIAEVMVQLRFGAMPVVDEASGVEGIVTRTDILRTVVDAPLDLWA